MANKRVSELAADTSPQPNDLLLLADVEAFESKKLTLADLATFILSGGKITGSLSGTASYALHAFIADVAAFVSSSVSASFATTASFALNGGTGGNSISSSWASSSISASFATYAKTTGTVTQSISASFSSNANHANTASYLVYSGYNNGMVSAAIIAATATFATNAGSSGTAINASSASWAVNSISASYVNLVNIASASHALYADTAGTAVVGITVNVQSSASWASQSLSSSLSQNSISSLFAQSASFATPSPAAQQQGIFSAITQSSQVSQIDSVNVVPYFLSPTPTAFVEVAGTIVAYYTSSVILNENVYLYVIDRFTGVTSLLDSTPIYVNIQGQYSSITASLVNVNAVGASLTGSFTGSFTGSNATSGVISGSMSGSLSGSFNGQLSGLITGSVSTLLSGSIKFPFNLMGQTGVNTINLNPESLLVFITASSNKISIEPTRLSKFNISTKNGQFSIGSGDPLQLTTVVPSDIIAFGTSTSQFNASASQMLAAGSASFITSMNISSLTSGVKYIWTLPNLQNLTLTNNFYVGDIKGMPTSIVTMSIQNGSIGSLYPLNNTSASILICSLNLLTGLPSLPATMSYINCSQNNIVALPNPLPYRITTLLANNNFISTTPTTLPSTLVSMSISFNTPLNSWVAAFPSSLQWLDISFCPNLTSVPSMGTNMKYLNFQACGLTDPAQFSIVSSLVSNAQVSGSLNLLGNALITTPATITNIGTLQTRGWTVSY